MAIHSFLNFILKHFGFLFGRKTQNEAKNTVIPREWWLTEADKSKESINIHTFYMEHNSPRSRDPYCGIFVLWLV